jgi:DUF2075 family protein
MILAEHVFSLLGMISNVRFDEEYIGLIVGVTVIYDMQIIM